MNIPQDGIERRPSLRRYHSGRRTSTLTIRCAPETKQRLYNASSDLLMSISEFVEWFMRAYSKNLVVIMEEGAFLDGLLKTVERKAANVAEETAERRVLQVLHDKGFISSPDPR